MLDSVAYRASEASAKRAIADWRLANVNDPYIFENQGFPVRADSFLDLAQILDTMQEGRFDSYMREIGGLSDEDADRFLSACVDYIDFHVSCFQRERVVVPLSTLISHFLIYKKLLGYNAGFKRLLEIGPGCGYLPFFLRDHADLVDYSQIESTESFYLLQSHINSHVFGSRFSEHALSGRAFRDHGAYFPKLEWYTKRHYETQNVINVQTQSLCNHFPWWRIGDVAERRYDIVTCNANLNEFSREALFQYLSLFRDVLADDGAIVAQCLGGGAPTHDMIFTNMKSAGFVPVALVQGDNVPGRYFDVPNCVFVGEKHSLFAEYAKLTPKFPMLDRDLPFIDKMYFMNERPQRKQELTKRYILHEILDRIEPGTPRSVGGSQKPKGKFGVCAPKLETDPDDGATRSKMEKVIERIVSSAHLRDVNRLRRLVQLEGKEVAGAGDGNRTEVNNPTKYDSALLAQELENLRYENKRIRSSRSWRVTAPLRSFGVWVRRHLPFAVRLARWFRA